MNRFLALGALVMASAFSVTSFGATGGALIDPSLKAFALGATDTNVAKVLVLLAPLENANLQRPERYNRDAVVDYFKEATRLQAEPLLADLQNNRLPGVKVDEVFWINGSVVAEVTPAGLKALALNPAVEKIYLHGNVGQEPGMGSALAGKKTDDKEAFEYDVTSLGLDRLYKEKPNILGTGVTVGIVDTGVDGSHPALAGKVVAFWNGETHSTSAPVDFDKHGTHVSGTIAGGDRVNNWIGVAPGAKLAVAGALQGYDEMLQGMQWFIDSNTRAGKVKAVSCSWNTGGTNDQEVFYKAIAAWEAAGILPVFSAGNNGPGTSTITHPHEYPGTFAVGAYGPDGRIASFSSRGPGIYKGQKTAKPDLSAPGVDIRSSVPGGQYDRYDGTSMATPHVTGTAALLLQVNPNFNPAQLRQILVKSAVTPQGMTAGQWDANWGYGQLSSYNAVMAALKLVDQAKDIAAKFITTPAQLDDMALRDANMGEVGTGSDKFDDTDRAKWLTVSELYN